MSAAGWAGWTWSSILCQLVGTILRVLGLEAVVAHQRNGDGLKQLPAHGVLELKHLRVVVAALEQRGDAEQHEFASAGQDNHFLDEADVTVSGLLTRSRRRKHL